VIVSLPSTASPQTLDALIRRHRLTRLQSWNVALTGTSFHRLQISDGRSVSDVIREIDRAGGGGLAQPNYRFTLQQAPPARGSSSSQYSLGKLNVNEAHRLTTGAGVPVAIIDNGIDALHPELAGAIAGRFDAVERPEVSSSHGTGMAGAIVAHARLIGVAPAARILAVRAFGAAAGSEDATTISIVRGIDWAITHGARVINMSFAGPRDPEIASALEAAGKHGIVLVAAAGNAGPKSASLYPAADPNVIA
jgi:subtilisin family serine protease